MLLFFCLSCGSPQPINGLLPTLLSLSPHANWNPHSCFNVTRRQLRHAAVFCMWNPLSPGPSTGVGCNQLQVPDKVNAVLGRNITLSCKIDFGSNITLTQSSWDRRLPSGTITLAVYNPRDGIYIPQEYARRVSFVSPSARDATIVITGATFADIGTYICKVSTFPLGIDQAVTSVQVLGELLRSVFSLSCCCCYCCAATVLTRLVYFPNQQSCHD